MGLLSISWQFNICGWVIRERDVIKGLQHIRNEHINLTSENFLGCGFLKQFVMGIRARIHNFLVGNCVEKQFVGI
jgi:hypothetical protein